MSERKISKIFDFTEKLNEIPNSYCFNPSIAHWKDDLYLISYRIFVRYLNIEKRKEYSDYHNEVEPNHPWLGGNGSNLFWKTIDGYDRVGFCIMKINKNNMNLYKPLNDGNSIYYKEDNNETLEDETFLKSKDKHLEGYASDARLLKLEDGRFLLSYNTFVDDENFNIKDNETCKDKCILIATRILKIIDENLYIYDENILCPEISQKTEKNWSFYEYDGEIYFSYGLTPRHTIHSVVIVNNDTVDCRKNDIIIDPKNYYGIYEDLVNPNGEKFLHVSLSTPSIPSKNNDGKYIGVGHVKYVYKAYKKIKSKSLRNLVKKTRNTYDRHPYYDYLMFIYEFDPENGKISRVSDMFIPEDSKYMLVFPSGLIYNGTDLWIFYGDHDSYCKVMIIKKEIVNKILRPANENLFENDNIKFFTFPKICLDKTQICELILNI